ncbi:MAG: IS3 family transposase, partial [Candidatus Woesearchaeota archaeon]
NHDIMLLPGRCFFYLLLLVLMAWTFTISVGKCIDNGSMEGFFGILKSEMLYGKKFNSFEELSVQIIEYIEFYNERRFQKRLE